MSSDMWDRIKTHIPWAIEHGIMGEIENTRLRTDIMEKLEARYRKGSIEHNNNWLDFTEQDLLENMTEEILDLIIYIAMNRVRKEETRMYGAISLNQSKRLRANLSSWQDTNKTDTESGE